MRMWKHLVGPLIGNRSPGLRRTPNETRQTKAKTERESKTVGSCDLDLISIAVRLVSV